MSRNAILMGTEVTPTNGGKRDIVQWRPEATINGHGLVVGASGVGKTHRLRRIAESLAFSYGARVIVIDVHGDINIDGEQRAVFNETSPYGLNPLKVNPDPASGGVNRRIRGFISMINRTSHKLGARQEAAMRRLVEDIYEKNGFDATDPRTWDPRNNPDARGRSRSQGVYPNISDLKRYSLYKYKQLMTGAGGEAFKSLQELNKTIKSLNRQVIRTHNDVAEKHALDYLSPEESAKLKKLRDKATATYADFISAVKTGDEVNDLLRYTDIPTLASLVDRIDHLDKSGIFKDSPPNFRSGEGIQVYDIHSLGRDEQQMFVDVLLEDLWNEQKAKGPVSEPNTFIIMDEASIFVNDDSDHIINILIREARKFGLGIIFASQAISHFSEDVLANVGFKLILGVDQMFIAGMSRMLRVEAAKIEAIRPRQSALIQCKAIGDQRNEYVDIFLSR